MANNITNEQPVRHAPDDLLPEWMKKERTKCLNNVTNNLLVNKNKNNSISGVGSVIYWMQRDMRTDDNWALLWAASMASSRNFVLRVVYALPPPPPMPQQGNEDDHDEEHSLPPSLQDMPLTARHGHFLLGGLECVHAELKKHNIPFHVILPESHDQVGQATCQAILEEPCQAKIVVCDFSPLRQPRQWMELQAAPILERAEVPFYQVDAHNIVPVWLAGQGKRQIGARTLRPRIHKVIGEYLQDFPVLSKIYSNKTQVVLPKFNRTEYEVYLQMDESVPPVKWAIPGTKAGMKQYESFVEKGLKDYDQKRNDPTLKHISSNLSPWTNYGHVSFQRITMEVKTLNKFASGAASFIEEGVIRRELSDNFCYYTPNEYDSLTAALDWAQETLRVHSPDPREYVYTLRQLEEAKTYDDLWNAAQLQVVREGQMHGFLRMYWAKKILEWTVSPEFALRAAQYLNDKYALDGRDPNGFVGVGWSIMGIHDQGWKEREIFGKIRYMNYQGCQRKFSVPAFVAMYPGAAENAAVASGKQFVAAASKAATTNKRAAPSSSTPPKKSGSSSSSKSRLSKKLKS